MKASGIGRDQPLIAHDEAAKMLHPGEGPLHNPSAAIAAQFPTVLMGRPGVVPPRRNDRLNAPPGQAGAQWIPVIAPIRNQAVGPLAGPPGFAGPADGGRLEGRFSAGFEMACSNG
jgi:hypothetical protein